MADLSGLLSIILLSGGCLVVTGRFLNVWKVTERYQEGVWIMSAGYLRSFLKEPERGVELGIYLPGWGRRGYFGFKKK